MVFLPLGKTKHKMSGKKLLSAVSGACSAGKLLNFPKNMQKLANLDFILVWGLKCYMS